MAKFEVRVDVTEAAGTGETLEVATTVVVPDPGTELRPVALFGYPGGGYNRRYYDLQLDEGDDYSQAEHHARAGYVFVAIDHLAVGESTVPTQAVTYEMVARANTAAASEVFERLRSGAIDSGVPPLALSAKVGLGQSYGGFMLTIAQGNEAWFDGVGMLGWSGIQTQPPWPSDMSIEELLASSGTGLDHPMRKVFHYEDVPDAIVIADMSKKGPGQGSSAAWSTDFMPGGPATLADRSPLDLGAVADEAAAIDVPVLVVAGDLDVIADPAAEPTAYRSSRDVTVCTFPRMAHMHNFATTRKQLWDRIATWADAVAATTDSK